MKVNQSTWKIITGNTKNIVKDAVNTIVWLFVGEGNGLKGNGRLERIETKGFVQKWSPVLPLG